MATPFMSRRWQLEIATQPNDFGTVLASALQVNGKAGA